MASPAMLARFVLISVSLAASPASAGRAISDLARVSADPRPGDRLPLETIFWDETGNVETLAQAIGGLPTVVTFVDYACKNMCSAILTLTAAALTNSALLPGTDFKMIAIGLDPKLDTNVARDVKSAIIEPSSLLSSQTHFLTGDASSIAKAAAAVGYRFSEDVENRQFAHAAALLVVSGNGAVSSVLNATNVSGAALRQALIDARHARGGTISAFAPVGLLCYGLDPTHGRYTREIWIALRAGAAILVVALLGGVLFLARRQATT